MTQDRVPCVPTWHGWIALRDQNQKDQLQQAASRTIRGIASDGVEAGLTEKSMH